MKYIAYMAHITLSIPDEVYKLMKKYSEVNWSEIARRAIIKELLLLKAEKEGLTRDEFNTLLKLKDMDFTPKTYPFEVELKYLKENRRKGKERINYLRELEKA